MMLLCDRIKQFIELSKSVFEEYGTECSCMRPIRCQISLLRFFPEEIDDYLK